MAISGSDGPETAPPVWVLDADDVLGLLNTSLSGLSEVEVEERLHRYGPNRLPEEEGTSRLRIILGQVRSPLVYVLFAAMVVTAVIGHWADVLVIGSAVLVDIVIGYLQEYRAENAMRALLGIIASKATVLRQGFPVTIPGHRLVPGDVVLLDAGDVIPADLRILSAANLRVDESMLTGESLPVTKSSNPLSDPLLPTSDRTNMAFSGTSVISGHGRGVVVATGVATEVGTIAGAIRGTRRGLTPLQKQMLGLGRILTIAVLIISLLVFAIGILQNRGIEEMFLTAVAVGVSAIPESLPVVMTIALAVGIRRMAARRAIVRRLPAVETLGSCSVILTDKTGTLTENRMTVREIRAGGRVLRFAGGGLDLEAPVTEGEISIAGPVDGTPGRLLLAAALANEASLQQEMEGSGEVGRVVADGDPTDIALLVAARKGRIDPESVSAAAPRIADIPFDSDRLYAASIHRWSDGSTRTFLKGAPEKVIGLCDTIEIGEDLRPVDRDRLLHEAHDMADAGLRVLGVAAAEGEAAAAQVLEDRPSGLRFLGLVGMIDPPRAGVPEAVRRCRRAGIRVVMVTGDHATTGGRIAQSVGLADDGTIPTLTGTDLLRMSDQELSDRLADTVVFARMSPDQKLRVVSLMKARGEVVAVTGDGVNDAPALKAAHIGAAMGRSGTDVAREASDLVVTDDNFATIYGAVEEGRTAFSNIRNATFFLVASGVGEVLLIVATLIGGLPLPILPAQILWLNVVTNGIQDVALALEPGEEEQFSQPPRPPDEGVLSRTLVERSFLVGLTLAAGSLYVFLEELAEGRSLAYAQVATLTMLVIYELVQVGNSRSETRSAFRKSPFSNRILLIGCAASVAVHIAAMYWGPTQDLLRLGPLSFDLWQRILLLSLTVLVVVEVHKVVRSRQESDGRNV